MVSAAQKSHSAPNAPGGMSRHNWSALLVPASPSPSPDLAGAGTALSPRQGTRQKLNPPGLVPVTRSSPWSRRVAPSARAAAVASASAVRPVSTCRSRWQPPSPSRTRCTRRQASPAAGASVANSPAAPLAAERPLPVTSRQNAVPAWKDAAGKSRKIVSQLIRMTQ